MFLDATATTSSLQNFEIAVPFWFWVVLGIIALGLISFIGALLYKKMLKSTDVQISVGKTKISFGSQQEFEGKYIQADKVVHLVVLLSYFDEKVSTRKKDYMGQCMTLAENCSSNIAKTIMKFCKSIVPSSSSYMRIMSHSISDSITNDFKIIVQENHLAEKANGTMREEYLERKKNDLYRDLKTTVYDEWPTEIDRTEDYIQKIDEALEKNTELEKIIKSMFSMALSSIIDFTVQKDQYVRHEHESIYSSLKLAFDKSPDLLATAKLQIDRALD